MQHVAAPLVSILVCGAFALSGCFSQLYDGPEDYLSDEKYGRILVEIDHAVGKAPRQTALDLLLQRMKERLNKPDGVEFEIHSFETSETRWTADGIRAAEKTQRDHRSGGATAALHILYLPGRYQGDTDTQRVLGVAYSPSSIAIFVDNVNEAGIPVNPLVPLPFKSADVENSVLVHEFGHVLGLVNLATKMVKPHEATEQGQRGHSTNPDSVMYYKVETFEIRSFTEPPPTQFDADDISDLRAAGGR